MTTTLDHLLATLRLQAIVHRDAEYLRTVNAARAELEALKAEIKRLTEGEKHG